MTITRDDIARFIGADKYEAFRKHFEETVRLYEEGKISKEEMDTFVVYYSERLQYFRQHLAERQKALEEVIDFLKEVAVSRKTKLN